MQVVVLEHYDALSQLAAAMVADLVRVKPDAALGLPTGTTPEGFYKALIATGVNLERVRVFNLDEYRGLPRAHSQSYYNYMRTHLFDHVNIPAESVEIPDGMAPDAEAECRRYEDAIRAAGGLDVVVLGLGHNGHIGFNEPGTPWDARTRRVALDTVTRSANARFFGSLDQVPHEALTMGIGTILEARQILLLAVGTGKAEIVRQTVEGTPSVAVPATALRGHPDVTVLLDREAAVLLDREAAAGLS